MNAEFTPRMALLRIILTIACITAMRIAFASLQPGMAAMPPPAMVLQQMHMVNRMEIQAAKLAMHKAAETPVQRYAERLWRDHRLADHKVRGLAEALGFQLRDPAQLKHMMRHASMAAGTPGATQRIMQKMRKKMQMVKRMMSKLRSASGSKFDRAYIMAMLKTHRRAISMLQKVRAHKLKQPRVKGLVATVLPILKQHLKLAEHLQHRSTPVE